MEFKTDNRDLFEFSLEEVEAAGWKLMAQQPSTFIMKMTNDGRKRYDRDTKKKFSSMGNPICKLVACR